MFEVLNFGVRGVVIVMLLRPPDCLWSIVFDGCIDKHVAASFFFIPFTSFSPELFLKEVPGTQTACHTKRETTSLSSIKRIFCMTTYAKYLIFRRFCSGGAFRCFWRSGELKSGDINNSCMPRLTYIRACVYACAC